MRDWNHVVTFQAFFHNIPYSWRSSVTPSGDRRTIHHVPLPQKWSDQYINENACLAFFLFSVWYSREDSSAEFIIKKRPLDVRSVTTVSFRSKSQNSLLHSKVFHILYSSPVIKNGLHCFIRYVWSLYRCWHEGRGKYILFRLHKLQFSVSIVWFILI